MFFLPGKPTGDNLGWGVYENTQIKGKSTGIGSQKLHSQEFSLQKDCINYNPSMEIVTASRLL